MGLVLWIDGNTFATSLLEKVFKSKNLPFYTLDKAVDFTYLVEDLKPELLVLDGETALQNLESLQKQYEASPALRNLPVILVDKKADLPFIQKEIGEIKRPFDPFKIPEVLEKILKSH